MAKWSSTAQRLETAAERTIALHFRKPENFVFDPGQTITLSLLPAGTDDAPLKHTFSLVSAPYEDDLCITTRLRQSAFKQALASLKPGAPLTFSGPYGRFALPKDTGRPVVLIAGGIGITPFISMLRHATHHGSPQRFLLLYSNRHPQDAAFIDELRDLVTLNPNFRLQATVTAANAGAGTDTSTDDQAWPGLHGRIDEAMVRQALVGLSEPLFYVTGTPEMVESMRDLLEGMGIDESAVRSEDFGGY